MIVPLFGMGYVPMVGLCCVPMVYTCTPVWNGLVVHGRVTVDIHMHIQPEHQLGTVDLHMHIQPEHQLGTVYLHMHIQPEHQLGTIDLHIHIQPAHQLGTVELCMQLLNCGKFKNCSTSHQWEKMHQRGFIRTCSKVLQVASRAIAREAPKRPKAASDAVEGAKRPDTLVLIL